jgi:hypothetical protein
MGVSIKCSGVSEYQSEISRQMHNHKQNERNSGESDDHFLPEGRAEK